MKSSHERGKVSTEEIQVLGGRNQVKENNNKDNNNLLQGKRKWIKKDAGKTTTNKKERPKKKFVRGSKTKEGRIT